MTELKRETVSWWVGLDRDEFSKKCAEKQVELERSTEGQRGESNPARRQGRPAAVPRVRG